MALCFFVAIFVAIFGFLWLFVAFCCFLLLFVAFCVVLRFSTYAYRGRFSWKLFYDNSRVIPMQLTFERIDIFKERKVVN